MNTATHSTNGKRNGHGHKHPAELSEYVFGKVQPQAIPLEEAILGAIMLDREALSIVLDILRPESFYTEAHQTIFRACIDLFNESEPIDLLTVTERLRKTGELENIGGGYYLVELSHRVASAANIEYHARIVQQKAMQRRLIESSTRTIRDAYEDTTDVFDLLEQAEKDLFEIVKSKNSTAAQGIGSVMAESIRKIEKARTSEGLTGIPSGWTSLDRFTGGWQPSDFVIVAARPGMGKTSFVIQMLLNAAHDFKKPVALFSLEMPAVQITDRIISMRTGVDLHKLRRGEVSNAEMEQIHGQAGLQVPIYIDDTAGLSLFDLRARCRRLKMKHDIQMVVVDYLQLMNGERERGGNREQEISSIARGLKSLAKELNIPVIALSQLSRAVESRGGSKRPMLSDLRESGSLEQDADAVVFIYRPWYYKIEMDEEGNSVKDRAEIIFAKHRNGPVDVVNLRFIEANAMFSDLDTPKFPLTETDFSGPQPFVMPRMNEQDIPF